MFTSVPAVNAWTAKNKLIVADIDVELESQIASSVISRITGYNTTLWKDERTIPSVVKTVISMIYAGRLYQEAYADDVGISDYGTVLINDAEALLDKIINGSIILYDIDGVLIPKDIGGSAYFEPVFGEPKFTMDSVY